MSKIEKFEQDTLDFQTKFDLAVENIYNGCQDVNRFKLQMSEAKAIIENVRADAADIRTVVRDTILPEIKLLKDQIV